MTEKYNILNILPYELWESITDFLPLIIVINLTTVCKRLYDIIHSINFINRNKLLTNKKYIPFISNSNNQVIHGLATLKWLQIPIRFIITEFHINVFNLGNIFTNYLDGMPNIKDVYYKSNSSIPSEINIYDNINEIPKSIESINYSANLCHNISEPPPYIFKETVKHLKLNLNSVDLSLFQIPYGNLLSLQLNNINFNSLVMSDELKGALSNIKKLCIINGLTPYDMSFLKNNEVVKLANVHMNQGCIDNFKDCREVILDFNSIFYEDVGNMEAFRRLDLSVLNSVKKVKIFTSYYNRKDMDLYLLRNVQYLDLYSCKSVGFSHPTFMNCKVLALRNTNIQDEELQYLKYVERLSISDCNQITDLGGLKDGATKILDISYNKKIKQIDFLIQLDVLMMCECSGQIELRNHMTKMRKRGVKIIKESDDYHRYNKLFKF